MNPTVFPTQHILLAVILSTIAYMLLFFAYSAFRKKNVYLDPKSKDKSVNYLVFWLLFAAFVIRIALSVAYVGHKTDIRCFAVWADNLTKYGFKSFYDVNSGLPDYPPGYMYINGLMSRLSKLVGHPLYAKSGSYDLVYVTFIKLPSIIADLAASYFVFRIARRKFRFAPSFVLMAIVALSPIMAYISGAWGQIDQILTVLIVLTIYLLNSNRPILGGIVFGLAILMKPQALMVGPLIALAYIFYIVDPDFFENSEVEIKNPGTAGVRFVKTCIAVICAVALIIIAALPFSTKELPWYQLIYNKYLGTATSYKYASVNAYNLYSLFGHNWAKTSAKTVFGLTFGTVGTIGMIFSVVSGGVLYWLGRKKNGGALYLSAAFTFISLFMLGHYMHERYMFPVLLLLVVAYLYYGDRKLLLLFFGFSVTALLNCLCAFYYSAYHEYGLYWDTRLVFGCSLANTLLYLFFIYTAVKILAFHKLAGDVFGGEDEDNHVATMPVFAEHPVKEPATSQKPKKAPANRK